ncbi:MAG TPA: hypothetical protein VI685_12410 [Candidatus Angelobacter sp.]
MHLKIVVLIVLSSVFALGQRPYYPSRVHGHLSSLAHLKTWANEYPVSAKRNIFKDAALHRALLHLLGKVGYQRLVEDFQHSAPVEIIDGYFVMHSVPDISNPNQETAFVVFWMYYDTVLVAFKSEFGVDWRPVPEYGQPTVPECVSRMVQQLGPWSPPGFSQSH